MKGTGEGSGREEALGHLPQSECWSRFLGKGRENGDLRCKTLSESQGLQAQGIQNRLVGVAKPKRQRELRPGGALNGRVFAHPEHILKALQ